MPRRAASVLLAAAAGAAAVADTQWAAWKARHGRRYATPAEESRRRALYDSHMAEASLAAADNPFAAFGATKFADWTDAEWNAMLGARGDEADAEEDVATPARVGQGHTQYTPPPTAAWTHSPTFPQPAAANASDAEVKAAKAGSVDWRVGPPVAVTSVKNQSQCGGCWAFSAIANMEGQWALAGHKLKSFSAQEVLSCSVGFPSPGGITKCNGCGGGWIQSAMDWVITANGGGINSEDGYKFTGQHGHCNKTKQGVSVVGGAFKAFEMVPNDEGQMVAYMAANGPLSVVVCARSLKYYNGGLMSKCVSSCYNHAVTLVAYGHDKNTSAPYWVIKNSWGTDWGEDGYARVHFGENACGLGQGNPASMKRPE